METTTKNLCGDIIYIDEHYTFKLILIFHSSLSSIRLIFLKISILTKNNVTRLYENLNTLDKF